MYPTCRAAGPRRPPITSHSFVCDSNRSVFSLSCGATMPSCTFVLNNRPFTTLISPVGIYTAFSGNGEHRNNPDSVAVPDGGPIPGGVYYIVDRESGGMLGSIRDWALGRDQWFALYRDDGRVDDYTFVQAVSRGLFRLHPLGPRRMSTGCIVLQYRTEFDRLREHLIKSPSELIPGSALRTHGTICVGAAAPDILQRGKGQPGRQAIA